MIDRDKLKEFLERFGLYRRFLMDDTISNDARMPTIQRTCTNCGDERTWQEARNPVQAGPVRRRSIGLFSASDQYIALHYSCSQCFRDAVFFVLRFDASDAEPGFNVMKIGQYPPWSIEPPKEMADALGAHLETYKKGTVCESEGYGIGAFAYYRRIVESLIDKLLADIGDVLAASERTKYEQVLHDLGKSKVAQEKIAVVKDLVPAYLRPGGVNPLGIMHDALSVGLHSLDDEDCLTLAEMLRSSMVTLTKHISLFRQERDAYAGSINAITSRLEKIKGKREASAPPNDAEA